MSKASDPLYTAIEKATKSLLNKPTATNNSDEDGLVFVGNWHGAYPAALIIDPNLEAIDVRVYLFICQHSKDFSLGAIPFPSYDLICERLGVSKPTLANSMARLRLTRWVSLVKHGIRDEQGRFKGQVLALSDEPIPLVDALKMDAGYLDLVEKTALKNNNKRTRQVAQGVLIGIQEQTEKGINPLDRKNPTLERHESALSINAPDGLFYGVASIARRQKEQRKRLKIAELNTENTENTEPKSTEDKTLLGQNAQQNPSKETLPGAFPPSKETLLGTQAIDFKAIQNSLPGHHPSKESLPGHFPPSKEFLPGQNPSKETLPGAFPPSKETLLGTQAIDFKAIQNSLPGSLYCTSTSNSISTVQGSNFLESENLNPKALNNSSNSQSTLNWYDGLIIITEKDKEILEKIFNSQTQENAQAVLDALAFRYQSVNERGADPLRSPVIYARSLLKRIRSGTFVQVKPEFQTKKPIVKHPSHRTFVAPEENPNIISPELRKARISRINDMLSELRQSTKVS